MSEDNNEKNLLFDLIAPIYGLFYNYQKRHFKAALDSVQSQLDLSEYKNIIDIGCGTGALCSVLHGKGLSVTGIDPARKMLNIAKKKNENSGIELIEASSLERLPFSDKSFDISIASYVAHGINEQERKIMYQEMSRITKHLVIIYDYNENRSLLTNTIEWLEGGDYFNFIRTVKSELKVNFREMRVLNVGVRESLYICAPN